MRALLRSYARAARVGDMGRSSTPPFPIPRVLTAEQPHIAPSAPPDSETRTWRILLVRSTVSGFRALRNFSPSSPSARMDLA